MKPLTQIEPTLPSGSYFDPDVFRAELDAIWYRDWIPAGHESDWPGAGDYRVVSLGSQSVVVLRDLDGAFRAFHNTCRHRGSQLCELESGRFASGRIVCPYHAWTYALDGSLQATPRRVPSAGFDPADYPLYPVRLERWSGFVFISLSRAQPGTVAEAFGEDGERLARWPLGELRLAHRETHDVGCNWKIFWENFLECYHCPGNHPELCRLVPVYGKGLLGLDEQPDYRPEPGADSEPRLAPGMRTWSADGQLVLPPFSGIDAEDRSAEMHFAMAWPAMFLVAHRDYLRAVRLRPLGPERIELTVEWLVDARHDPATVDIEQLTAFGRLVVLQDARVCEFAQRGLRCREHRAGVLVGQEYDVLAFDRWVEQRLAAGGEP